MRRGTITIIIMLVGKSGQDIMQLIHSASHIKNTSQDAPTAPSAPVIATLGKNFFFGYTIFTAMLTIPITTSRAKASDIVSANPILCPCNKGSIINSILGTGSFRSKTHICAQISDVPHTCFKYCTTCCKRLRT